MAGCLAIWLYGDKVALVEQVRHRLRLQYMPEALRSFPGGTPLLSLKLPLTAGWFPNGVVRSFLDGQLPEGEARRVLAEVAGIAAGDTFGLARALGRDCAGALVLQPEEEPAPPNPTTLGAEPLTAEGLAALVENLRSAPLGVDHRVRISLAGVQEKLLLTRLPDGTWGRPIDGTPSTHILKPEIRGYPQTVENEAFCMRLAKYAGLDVAEVDTTVVEGRHLLVVSRYDRRIAASGAVERVHQEDFCQATGTPPSKKYQEDGGPSLRVMAGILRAVDPPSLERLLCAVTLNVIIGNGDAHAKNFSLVHEVTGGLRLAPLYDLMCTLLYGDDRLAMYVDDVRRTNRVTLERIVNEAAGWGMPRSRAQAAVTNFLARIPAAAQRAADETPGLPSAMLGTIRAQLNRLQDASSY